MDLSSTLKLPRVWSAEGRCGDDQRLLGGVWQHDYAL